MKKAIMIVDLPDFCTADCPMYLNCREAISFYKKRPETCLLLPVPNMKVVKSTDSNYDRGYAKAWNDFIEKLNAAEKDQKLGKKQKANEENET